MSTDNAHALDRVLAETFAVARAEIFDMVKSIRFAFLVISYAFAAGIVGSALLWVNEKMDGKLLMGAAGLGESERTAIVEGLAEQGMSTYLAEAILNGDLPPMVFGVLFFSTFSIPLLMLLVGFNRISEDVSTRYTRYLLQRVHRGSYLAGKLIGHWLVSFVAIVLVHIALLSYAKINDLYDMESTIAAMPRIWFALLLLVLGYSAYTTLVSATLNPPILVLLLGAIFLMGIRVVQFFLGLMYEPLGKVWMGSWDVELYALDPIAVAIYLGYAAVFIALAHLVLRRRDL